MNIYQPDYLVIEAGTSVQTKNGVYTAQSDEKWWSDKQYRLAVEKDMAEGYK